MTTVMLVETASPGTAVAMVPVQAPAPPPGQGEEFGKSSPVGLVVVLLLAVVTGLLIRSMTRRIRRLPTSFGSAADGGSADGSGRPGPPEPRDVEDAGGGRP